MRMNRRRFLSITAMAGAACALPSALLAASKQPYLHWSGIALGADASIKLYLGDKAKAKHLTKACLREIMRLEKLFSLYEPSSTLSQLNRDGFVENPPAEFVSLLREAKRYSALTDGAFDVTVQPLWESDDKLELVDYRNLHVSDARVSFTKPSMAATLNGIAQGAITDKITELLKAHGVARVLVNMGEMRALGSHADGAPWQVGIANPDQPQHAMQRVALADQAIATSGNYGTVRDHIIDPRTGQRTMQHRSVSVIAPTATAADALSTGLSILSQADGQRIIGQLPNTRAIWL